MSLGVFNGNELKAKAAKALQLGRSSLKLSRALPKSDSVMFTWILSYALILLVPVVITTISYFITANVLEKEISKSNTVLLKKVQQQMDSLLEEAGRLGNEIAIDARVNDFLKRKKASELGAYDIYQLVRNLRAYKIINSSIDDFYIYFKHLDLVISSEGSYDSKSYYMLYLNNTGLSYPQWLKMVSDYYRDAAFPVRYEDSTGEIYKTIAFTRSLPLYYSNESSANVVIILNESRFMNDVWDIGALNQGLALIVDKNNNVLASSNHGTRFAGIDFKKISENDEGLFHQRLSGKNSVVSYITSKKSEWRYLVITPVSVFRAKADYVRNLTIFSVVLCLVVGGFICYRALRKNYNPIEQLIKLLENYQGSSFDKKNNEYSFIQQAIAKVYSDLEAVDSTVQQQNKLLRTHFLTRLLQGKETDTRLIQDRLQFHDIHFKTDHFGVMAFYIDDFYSMELDTFNTSDQAVLENFKRAQAVIVSTINDRLDNNLGFTTDIDDLLVCLINLETGGAEGKQAMIRIATESQRILRDNYQIQVMVSASGIHNAAGIAEAFTETLQAMEYKKLLGIEDLVLHEDLNDLPKGDYYYPLEKEQQLINCIKTGDLERSKLILDEIFCNNFEKSFLPVKIARCLMFNLVSTMIKTVNEINDANRQGFLDELNPIETLLNCESINEMKLEMMTILARFCEYIQLKNKEKTKGRQKENEIQLKDQVMEFVKENFTDPNLGITTIAQQFNVHPVHLSRTFLEQNGEGLLDFINRIRLRKAKQLFRELSNLDEVAKAVGYSNTRTFTRAFKKYEGTTPGKYKDTEHNFGIGS